MKTLYIDLDTTTSCTKNLAISRKEDPHWGIVDITMQTKLKKINFKIIDMNDDFVAKSFSNIACYEPFFISTWTDFLSKTEGIILDIGASTGLYSLISQAYARNRIVYAFEPYPRAYSRLILNKDINKFAKIKIIPCALADCTKIGLFMINNFEGPITTNGIDEKNKKLEKTTTFSGSITNFVAISNNFKW